MFRTSGTIYTLVDVAGERVVLHDEPEAGWGPEVRQAVTCAQLPRAVAALDAGERLTFGDIWLTREMTGSRKVFVRWSQVQRIEIRNGTIELSTAGKRHALGPASEIPNLFVFCAVVERIHRNFNGGV